MEADSVARWVRCPDPARDGWGTAKQGANNRDGESLGMPVYDKLFQTKTAYTRRLCRRVWCFPNINGKRTG